MVKELKKELVGKFEDVGKGVEGRANGCVGHGDGGARLRLVVCRLLV